NLELLARLLVDVGRAVDGELLNSRRQRDRTADESTRATRRVGDVAGSLIQHSMIERLQANPDVLRFHIPTDAKEPANRSRCRDPLKKLLTNCKPRESDDPRGWRPILLRVLGHIPCADGPAAFADCEA